MATFAAMRLIDPRTLENIKVALRAIRGQLLRSVITVTIITFGIMALVAFSTVSEAMSAKINETFSAMGSNTLVIKSGQGRIFGGRRGVRQKQREPITYEQARAFVQDYPVEAVVSVSAFASATSIIKYASEKTNPNVQVIGGDEQYLELAGYEIEVGRNFSQTDDRLGSNVVIMGADVIETLFGDEAVPLDKVISIGSYKYTVIGTLVPKGSTLGMSQDNQCLIPISNLKKNFGNRETDYTINVKVDDPKALPTAEDEAFGLMGVIRGDLLSGEETFSVAKSDAFASQVDDSLGVVRIGVTVIGYLTLFGAAIGLMNIMLVSVTERTREIGVRKAIGASSRTVMVQFLTEAIIIGQIGGVMGIVVGILLGNSISFFLETPFTIPWNWIMYGVVSCFIMSVLSGYLPARKAARLLPIESLRYE